MEIQPKGTIKWHNVTQGYGFITTDGCRQDTFFHIKNCKDRELVQGDRVTYEFLETKRGLQAINVKKI